MGKTKLRGPANPAWWKVPGNRERICKNLKLAIQRRRKLGLHVGRIQEPQEFVVARAYQLMDTIKRKVDRKTGCWLWTGITWNTGYGRMQNCRDIPGIIHGRVHITAWLRWKGSVPAGKMICHTCNVKRCFNPDHLYAGTNQENQIDAVKTGVFERYWTAERRAMLSLKNKGSNNPMYGVRGKNAPCWGRRGPKHPMFGKHHKEESRQKTSESLKKFYAERRKLEKQDRKRKRT